MSQNYQNYKKYQSSLPPAPCYQMTYQDGKIVINKGPKNDRGIMKKNTLKKFETLENKLRDYLAEFVKYTDGCKGKGPSTKAASGKSTPVKAGSSSKKIPIEKRGGTVMAYPAKTIMKPINLKVPKEMTSKLDKIFPPNLEKKIVDIERKTKKIQRYNHILEAYFKKNQIDDQDQEAIMLDPRLKQIIFDEVKNLEEILIEKRLEDQNIDANDIPEYEHCQTMLQECIDMLGDAINDERKDDLKLIELPPTKKQLVHKKRSRNYQDMSDDEFFDQYNLDINDEDDLEADKDASDKEEDIDKDLQKGIKMTDYVADDDDEDNDADELTPSQNIGEAGYDVDDNEEEPSYAEEEPVEEEEDAEYVEEYDPKPMKSFKHDKRKLYQIKDELANLEHNNQKFLSVLLGMKTSLQLKNSEEEDVSGYEFAEEIHKMREVTRDFGESKKNVDKLIRKLKKHTRYSI